MPAGRWILELMDTIIQLIKNMSEIKLRFDTITYTKYIFMFLCWKPYCYSLSKKYVWTIFTLTVLHRFILILRLFYHSDFLQR